VIEISNAGCFVFSLVIKQFFLVDQILKNYQNGWTLPQIMVDWLVGWLVTNLSRKIIYFF